MFAFLEPFFRTLNDGKILRLTAAWVLRVLAVLLAMAGLLVAIFFVRLGIRSGDNSLGVHAAGVLFGALLFALIGLAWGYLQAGICFYRARSIDELEDSQFTVLSILSLMFRLIGEQFFVTYSLLGVGGCLFVWLTDSSPLAALGMLAQELPFASNSSSGFLGGIELAVLMLLVAFVGLILFYALAESTVVLVEIAVNTRGLRAPAANGPVPAAPPVMPTATPTAHVQTPPPPAPQTSVQKNCRKCHQPLDLDSPFCSECGEKVG